MLSRNGSIKTPSLRGATVLAWALAVAFATVLAQLFSDTPAWQFDSAVHLTSDLAVATGLGWTLFQLALHEKSGRERSRWILAFWAMVVLGAIQATDWLVGSGFMADDWLVDLPFWLAATAMVRAVLRRGRERSGAFLLWRIGMGLQFVFIVCDLWEGKSLNAWSISAGDIASLAEWSELLAIECYVVALVLVGAARTDASTAAHPVQAVGAEARRIYRQAHLFRKAIYPPVRWTFWPGLRGAVLVAGSVGLVAVLGPAARRASGRTLRAQLGDLLSLSLRHDFDPLAYYFQELYREGGRAEAAFYLTRSETKNGLLHVLNSMRPSPDGPREMKDKVLFAACCRREGLPVASTLLESEDGGSEVAWSVPRDRLDRDLFCKLRSGRGARGVLVFRRVGPHRYLDPDGEEIDLETVRVWLQAASRTAPVIVQPRLRNHPELADLADRSLVTVRVLTCLDSDGRPVVTHAFLRILSKLEPKWRRKDEYGVPIDRVDGRLGAMCSDRLASGTRRFSHHPVTGQAVEGRVLESWPAIQALALDAHRAFSHRIFVGWDIAMTDEGPVLLEGNVNLDIMFPQRVHRQGIGRSALGPLLQHHLAALARSHDVD
ncbi:sugar-transfer associated ATP-grasp domain-containing protein [Variovorax sp. RHLX14]|uniref:sugar-transfer associated ATP-grasp domain-containing protein n=1 Tax=Variovorax sp. RHLX14 TaxID=1259731 RepID=UPI003F455630